MKSLINFIKESRIINESFQCTYLIDVDNVFRAAREKFNKICAEVENEWQKPYRGSYNAMNDIIRYSYGWLRFDKITDENFEEYAVGDPMTDRVIRRILKGNVSGIVVAYNKNNTPFAIMINSSIWSLPVIDHEYHSDNFSASSQRFSRQYEALDFFKYASQIYICEISNRKNTELNINSGDPDSQTSRRESRAGMIQQGDPQFYDMIAKENRERWAKTIAMNKANKDDDEEIYDRITDIMENVAQKTKTYMEMSDEDKSANDAYFKRLFVILSDINSSSNNTLMVKFFEYKRYKERISKSGGDKYDRRWHEEAKLKLEQKIKDIEDYLNSMPF